MPLITRLMLQNFKKFPELDLRFTHDRNILPTILLALKAQHKYKKHAQKEH